MRKGTFKMRERGCQMRHFRAIAQDLAALIRTQLTELSQLGFFFLHESRDGSLHKPSSNQNKRTSRIIQGRICDRKRSCFLAPKLKLFMLTLNWPSFKILILGDCYSCRLCSYNVLCLSLVWGVASSPVWGPLGRVGGERKGQNKWRRGLPLLWLYLGTVLTTIHIHNGSLVKQSKLQIWFF